MNAVVAMQPAANVDAYRLSTDAASICKDIVVATASNIQGRKYVCVEGWQAIAVAHGCAASACDVERVEGGVRATGQVRRMSDGAVIAEAEGFVGEDEPTWFGGPSRGKTLPKRADYAIRAMAQTRAISRACRSAFAHVVVMMNAGLSTTPAEEVPLGGFNDEPAPARQEPAARQVVEAKPQQAAAPKLIDDGQRQQIMTIVNAKNLDTRDFCRIGKIPSIPEMPAAMFDEAMKWLSKQPKRELASAGGAPAATDLDDEIPY